MNLEVILFVDPTSKIVISGIQTQGETYNTGISYNGLITVILPINTSISDYVNKKYYKNDQFFDLPIQPTQYHIWNLATESWEEGIDWEIKFKEEVVTSINIKAGIKITALYPIFKQLNLARSLDATTMYAYIDSIRDLSNVANAAIGLAINVSEIRAIESQFTADITLL